MRKFCLDLVIGWAGMLSLSAATHEVAQHHPQASDDASGTAERPWKTIAQATERASPGDLVVIRGGLYRERLLVRSSGTEQAPIRFEAAPGEHVVVTGADRLTGWEKADDTRPIYRVAWPHKFVTWNPTLWGWFDVKDDRHWPSGSAGTNQAAAKPGDLPGAPNAMTNEGQPQGLTLETLRLQFENNVYFAAPGQGWFKWGPTWARHKSYAGLSEFQSDLNLDTTSQVLDPGFADVRRWGFRLPSEMMVRLNEKYPRDPVPGVMLGVKP
jgi:hypothetical protein